MILIYFLKLERVDLHESAAIFRCTKISKSHIEASRELAFRLGREGDLQQQGFNWSFFRNYVAEQQVLVLKAAHLNTALLHNKTRIDIQDKHKAPQHQ